MLLNRDPGGSRRRTLLPSTMTLFCRISRDGCHRLHGWSGWHLAQPGFAGYLRMLIAVRLRNYPAGSTSNAGCLGAMARIWSSLESGPVPSKKIPTSAFHLFR
jgi:hypothetical protein